MNAVYLKFNPEKVCLPWEQLQVCRPRDETIYLQLIQRNIDANYTINKMPKAVFLMPLEY